MTLYSDRRDPQVLIRVNGEPAREIMDARVSFKWTDRIGKKQPASLVLSDPDRKIRDELLQPDDHYQISWGYPGNMTSPRNFRLKKYVTNHDASPNKVTLTLRDSGKPPKRFSPQEPETSEPGKTIKPRNWGKIPTSEIAKKIARRHGLTPKVDPSEDVDRHAYVQPGNTTDYAYLRRLAEVIDFEFFIENDNLYYRKKPFDERPRRVFYHSPSGGVDTLLLSFTPTAKVTKVSVKPRTVDVHEAESPWIAQERVEIAEELAEIYNTPTSDSERTVDLLTDEALPADMATAEAARDLLQADPSIDNQDLYQQRTAEVTLRLSELSQARKQLGINKRGSGKVALKQGSKQIGSQNANDQKCAAAAQHKGRTPTGNNPKGAHTKGFTELDLSAGTPELYAGTTEIGGAQAYVQTTAGSQAKRAKVACAAHAKMTDKAVTATARFIGDPSLRAKVNYEFRGVGTQFSGAWYAKEATHTVDTKFVVTMSLKSGKLKGQKRGTQNSAHSNKAGDQSSDGVSSDVDLNLESGVYNSWTQSRQASYDTESAASQPGFYTSDGQWVRRPVSTAVPPR